MQISELMITLGCIILRMICKIYKKYLTAKGAKVCTNLTKMQRHKGFYSTKRLKGLKRFKNKSANIC